MPSCRLAPLLIKVEPENVFAFVRVSVPVPVSIKALPVTGPVPEMTPANVVEVFFPPVVSAALPRVMELVELALAIDPTVLLKLPSARTPLVWRVTALRPAAPPKALVEPAVRVPLLTVVAPE